MADYNSVEVEQGQGDLIQAGRVNVNPSGYVNVTFPTPYSAPPVITTNGERDSGTTFFVDTLNITATGFQIRAYNNNGSGHANPASLMHWMAIGPK